MQRRAPTGNDPVTAEHPRRLRGRLLIDHVMQPVPFVEALTTFHDAVAARPH